MKSEYTAEFRFYGELNDFLPPEQRNKRTILYRFKTHPGIKDPIEVFGVPHTEVELIVVNGQSVGFDYQLQNGDRVAVYPAFRSLDINSLTKLREALHNPRFILDVNLGKLVKLMRLLGFDTLYRNDYRDADIVNIAVDEQRIVLTRDRHLLYFKHISHGYWVRAVDAKSQVDEVLRRFDLHASIHPFARCLICNGVVMPVTKADVLHRLEPKTRLYYEVFHQCENCQRIYWEGSHMEDMRQRYAGYLAPKDANAISLT